MNRKKQCYFYDRYTCYHSITLNGFLDTKQVEETAAAYVFKNLKGLKIDGTSLFSGSSLSIISSTCASCSSIGFLLISTFGGVGVTASAFLSNYQIPLRIISIALLMWALYSASNRLTKSCVLN